jgi:bacillithiol synthase
VKAECLSFSNIPHTTRLFSDFLHHFQDVSAFYARPPALLDWAAEERERIRVPEARRRQVAAVLERQNRGFGGGPKTLENIQRLAEGAPAIVTGQQVALFGGPSFTLLKALTVILLAEKTGAVPVFWLATEDHDFAEINFVHLPAGDHLQTLTITPPHREGTPVGAIAFNEEITAILKQVEELFGPSEILELLRNSYRSGETFGSAFAKLLASVCSEFGLILLNPLDSDLHRIAQPVFRDSFVKWKQTNEALMQRDQELEARGYHAQVKITPSHTLCFYIDNDVRTPIRHDGPETFLVGERKFSRDEMIAETETHPERFSPNVLLRPVVQDYLLPTLCYAGGPAEIAYFAQAEVVYRQLLERVTPVIPRISATLIEPRIAKLLERYQLQLPDMFRGPEKLREFVAGKALPESIMKSFDTANDHLEQALQAIHGPLQKLDQTLLDAAENAGSKMRYQIQSLRDKAARAEARKNTETQRHADELSTLLFPNKELQEREVGSAYFLLKYGTSVLHKLKERVQTGCVEHQIIPL